MFPIRLGTWLSIDCGSATSYTSVNGIYWQTDEGFINTGENKHVSYNSYTNLDLVNTLRAFKKQNKNCYALPTGDITRYFIRTTFYYGNYDGLTKPPTFDVEIDGNKWVTVVSSLTEILYYEVVYPSRGDTVSVCLARTKPNQFPFISSLEVWPVPDTMYFGMSRDLAWLSSYRDNYGTQDYILGYDVDRYNRIWKPANPTGLVPKLADTNLVHYTTYEFPPHSAIFDAVEASAPTKSITLTFQIAKTNSLNFIEPYFTEMAELGINQTRSFSLYVNNEYKLTTSPQYQNFTAALTLVQTSGTIITVELRPVEGSTLPPIVSAIEVYTASVPLITTGTSQDDLDGLAVFISSFDQLGGWSGEPCLPNDTVWEWLGCSGSDPPRVNSLSLSRYGLEGPLPDFSQMQALETIDLSKNNLNGEIPEFLGNLPQLKILNLADNDFFGDIPRSIISNKKIKYNVHGNPNLNHRNANRTAMIIGLAVGVPLGVILIVAVLVYFLSRKKPKPDQAQATESELVGCQVEEGNAQVKPHEDSVSISMSTEQMSVLPQHDDEMNEEISEDACHGNANQPTHSGNHEGKYSFEDIPVSVSAGNVNEASEVPDMDMDELDELLQRHENAR
ncbi:LRR receptor-like serine/threonine-protein kinase precursor, partial [Actinidia chinensis var. chinensis]